MRADDPYHEDEYCFRADPDARASLSCSASSLTSVETSLLTPPDIALSTLSIPISSSTMLDSSELLPTASTTESTFEGTSRPMQTPTQSEQLTQFIQEPSPETQSPFDPFPEMQTTQQSFPKTPTSQDPLTETATSQHSSPEKTFETSSSHKTKSTETTPSSNSVNGINLLQEGTANQISSLNEIIGNEDSSEGLKEELGKLVDLLSGLADSLTWAERRKQLRRP